MRRTFLTWPQHGPNMAQESEWHVFVKVGGLATQFHVPP